MLKKNFFLYCAKLFVIYGLLYYGSLAVIGLSAPGGYYSSIVHDYLDYTALLRKGLLYAAKWVLDITGNESEIVGLYKVKLLNGRGVKIVYSCLGIGLFSFWIAFIVANETRIKKKLVFLAGGLIAIFFINVARIVLLVIAANRGMKIPFNTDHHTLFNIASYTLIILLVLLFGWSEGRDAKASGKNSTH